MVWLRVLFVALTIVLVFAAVMAISLGYALPLDENASLTKTNCTYLSYTISGKSFSKVSYEKMQNQKR